MTEKEAIAYIENCGWSKTRLGLDRTRQLLAALGNPQKQLKFIHVTGSNGKGSTCAMLDSVLRRAGYKTGLYTSPYIQEFRERIKFNGEMIPADVLARLTEKVKAAADMMDDHPSQFELVTAIGMEYFREVGCNIVVLEVGMGGALDSTNAIDAPELAVITNIGLEHTEYLGSTLQAIAETKGGIIKSGASCVCYDGEAVVSGVISRICSNLNVPLTFADFSKLEPVSSGLNGQCFKYKGSEYNISLLGRHQLFNSATALECITALRKRGWQISEEAVKQGLTETKWPARLEILSLDPLFILDGGHNPQCAEALAESLKELFNGHKLCCILGVLADKDYKQVVNIIKPYVNQFVCLTPFSDRALPALELAEYLKSEGLAAIAANDVESGIEEAKRLANGGPILAFGSLYLAGAVRTAFGKIADK